MPSFRTFARCLLALFMITAVAVISPSAAGAEPGASSAVFINELHYDNAGADTGEFIEVAGPAGTDLGSWSLVLYNGNGGGQYRTIALSGVLADDGGGYGVTEVAATGMQNGSPDGVALVQSGAVVQFLSYEGSFAAIDGPAAGVTSTDIGVTEVSSTPVGSSLHLTGSGTMAGDFTWSLTAANSAGSINDGQTFGGTPTPARVVINEIDYDQPGSDSAEFVELYNGGGEAADLTGWTLRLVNGNGGADYDTIALSGSLAVGDYLVVCANAATVDNCDVDDGPDTNFLQNGAPDAVVLADGSGAVIDAVSYEGSVPGAVEGSGDGLADGSDAGRSIGRVADGTDTDQNNVDLIVTCTSPGEANEDTSGNCGVVELVAIHDIQGSGDASPLVGQTVAIEGVVVGDYEGASPNLRGFYVQEQDADADGDPATSEGIFVFHGSEDTVNLGDLVMVTGTVAEFQDQTQLGFPSALEVISSGNTVTPATITLPFDSATSLESVEGMLVVAPQTLYVTEYFQLGRFGQIVVSSGDRLDNPTMVAEPGPDAVAVQAANDLNRLIIDDATNDQNPDPIVFGRNGQPLSASNTLRGGDTLTGAVGVITYTWAGNNASGNAYRLRPVGDLSDSGLVPGGGVPDFMAANPRPTEAPDVGGSIQVASFNVLNYFLTLDEGATRNTCGPAQDQGCRGADNAEEFDRQRVKLISALDKIDADVVGIVEMENTPGVSPEGDLAAGLNDLLGPGTYAAIDAAAQGGGVVGGDTIRVGIIYKPGSVEPLGDPALLEFSTDDLGENRSRTAVAQSFVEIETGEVFSVVVNHFKSKGGSEIDDGGGQCSIDPAYPDCDQGDGQGYFNDIRTRHSAELVAWLATDPTGSGDADVLVLGDLNAYGKEDPIDVLVDAGYVNLTDDDDYSFVFNGQWGSLDYAFASPSLAASVTGGAHYHINADEPPVLDYNTNFQSPGQIASLFAPDEFRTSDHDPTIVGLNMDSSDGFTVKARPNRLWPPNHKYRTVRVSETGGATVEILSVTSSEADSGLGSDDKPNDIVIVSANKVKLRAERFSTDGRTYTISVKVTDGTQTVFTTVEVRVPHNRSGW